MTSGSKLGGTAGLAERMDGGLRRHGGEVDVLPARKATSVDGSDRRLTADERDDVTLLLDFGGGDDTGGGCGVVDAGQDLGEGGPGIDLAPGPHQHYRLGAATDDVSPAEALVLTWEEGAGIGMVGAMASAFLAPELWPRAEGPRSSADRPAPALPGGRPYRSEGVVVDGPRSSRPRA